MNLSASRRLVAMTAASGLLLGGFALLGSAQAAGLCPLYTDPAGDAPAVANTPDGNPFTNTDDDLDLLDVSHSVDAGVFTTTVHVKGLGEFGPAAALSDRFVTAFTVGGKALTVKIDRDYTNPIADGTVSAVLTVDGTASTAKVTVVQDLKASTLVTKIAVADVEKAAGASLAGKPFSLMSTTSSSLYGTNGSGLNHAQDTATATATTAYAFGQSCSGGGAPVPAPTPTPTSTGTPTPTPTEPPASSGLFALPRKDCAAFKDAAGDGDPTGTGQFGEDSLDITQVNLKTLDGLQLFVKLTDLSAPMFPVVYDGPVYGASFTMAGKAVAISASADGPATLTVGGTDVTGTGATAKLDTKNSYVVFTLPTAGLTKALGSAPTAGTPVTATTATTAAATKAGARSADTATGTKPEEKTYAYGDNTCFQPPAGIVSFDAPASGVYSDKVSVTVSLLDADESAVPGATVAVQLPGGPAAKGITNDDGEAVITLPVTVPASATTLTARFAGNADVGAASDSAPFTVKLEKTVLKAVGGRGTVTATLTDDDKAPVAGQLVTFTVGSKVTKVKTSAKGVAVLTGQVKGALVKVTFAGTKGLYSAAAGTSAKVL